MDAVFKTKPKTNTSKVIQGFGKGVKDISKIIKLEMTSFELTSQRSVYLESLYQAQCTLQNARLSQKGHFQL